LIIEFTIVDYKIMKKMITKTELNVLIPYGKRKEVALKAGVSPGAVTKYFTDKTKSSYQIHKAALEVALECQNGLSSIEIGLSTK
jgi:hypothetical protein